MNSKNTNTETTINNVNNEKLYTDSELGNYLKKKRRIILVNNDSSDSVKSQSNSGNSSDIEVPDQNLSDLKRKIDLKQDDSFKNLNNISINSNDNDIIKGMFKSTITKLDFPNFDENKKNRKQNKEKNSRCKEIRIKNEFDIENYFENQVEFLNNLNRNMQINANLNSTNNFTNPLPINLNFLKFNQNNYNTEINKNENNLRKYEDFSNNFSEKKNKNFENLKDEKKNNFILNKFSESGDITKKPEKNIENICNNISLIDKGIKNINNSSMYLTNLNTNDINILNYLEFSNFFEQLYKIFNLDLKSLKIFLQKNLIVKKNTFTEAENLDNSTYILDNEFEEQAENQNIINQNGKVDINVNNNNNNIIILNINEGIKLLFENKKRLNKLELKKKFSNLENVLKYFSRTERIKLNPNSINNENNNNYNKNKTDNKKLNDKNNRTEKQNSNLNVFSPMKTFNIINDLNCSNNKKNQGRFLNLFLFIFVLFIIF